MLGKSVYLNHLFPPQQAFPTYYTSSGIYLLFLLLQASYLLPTNVLRSFPKEKRIFPSLVFSFKVLYFNIIFISISPS